MNTNFNTIAIIGIPRNPHAITTHLELYVWLTEQGYDVFLDDHLKTFLPTISHERFDAIANLGEKADLAIVIGGDGNMLGAARILARFDIAVIGINRGNFGFLTDLDPNHFKTSLKKVLSGEYEKEERFLLETQIRCNGELKNHNLALNEMVLHPELVAHMIEFEVYIDNKFAFSQRSDGLIVSTPTGSTAYSLSGGGPILSPNLDAISIVPMFPHTLSSRPLVVGGKRNIKLILSPENRAPLKLSCDGQVLLPASSGDEICIYQSEHKLQLIHPENYNYYEVLRQKLGWANKLF